MSNYRRLYVPSGTYFFTVVTRNRQPLFANPGNVERLYSAFRYTGLKRPFSLDAMVVLPDHLHCIWTVTDDGDFSTRWQMVKTHFSRGFNQVTREAKRSHWQKRFWEHLIRDDTDFKRHLDYVHYNPVKHGYVSTPEEWRYSTFAHFVASGFYSRNWGSSEPEWAHDLDLE